MKRLIIAAAVAGISVPAMAQFTLDSCQTMAARNYPLIRQYELIDRLADFSIQNAARAYLPQITLSGSASYISEVVSFPENMEQMFGAMGIDMAGLRNDQYKFTLDINQNIWDGGVSKAVREQAEAERDVSARTADVEMYSLRDRVCQIYFGILMLEDNLKQNDLVTSMLTKNYEVAKSCLDNGVAMEGEISRIQAELVSNSQNRANLEWARRAYLQVLSVMTGTEIDGSSSFERPEMPAPSLTPYDIMRPELALFDAQEKAIEAQRRSVNSSVMPKFSLFAQGLYGYPGLNMFEDMMEYKWSPNYIVGVRFQWNISSFYTKRNNLRKLETSAAQVAVQRDKFLYGNRIESVRKDSDIRKMMEMMEKDDELIALRGKVREASEAKFRNGTITASDLLKDINDEARAILDKSLHELEYMKNIYEQKIITNN